MCKRRREQFWRVEEGTAWEFMQEEVRGSEKRR